MHLTILIGFTGVDPEVLHLLVDLKLRERGDDWLITFKYIGFLNTDLFARTKFLLKCGKHIDFKYPQMLFSNFRQNSSNKSKF